MSAVLVLECRLGAPRWYPYASAVVFLAVLLAAILAPLKLHGVAGVMLLADLVLWCDWWQRKKQARYRRLCVFPDHTLSLIDNQGDEHPVICQKDCWVSGWLIVIPVRLACGESLRLLIARERNTMEGFRRLTVICRFAFAVEQGARHNTARSHITGA